MTKKKYFLASLVLFLCQANCFAETPSEDRKTIVVTGASGELGGAAARLLAADYDLILTGRNIDKLENLKKELQTSNSGRYRIRTLDFIDPSSRNDFGAYLQQTKLPVAGIVLFTPRPRFHGNDVMQDENIWLEVLQNTFTGPAEFLKITLPYLSDSGKVVVIAGTTSVQLQPEYGPACIVRRMWTTYTKALARQTGPRGISVNALSPGVVLTDFHRKRIQKQSEETGSTYEDRMKTDVSGIPLGRHAEPEEPARAIRFLLSEESNFITGVNLILDGGFTVCY